MFMPSNWLGIPKIMVPRALPQVGLHFWNTHVLHIILHIPSDLGQFNINYIIFRTVEIFKKYFFSEIFFSEGK